jgi:hypothetical protein
MCARWWICTDRLDHGGEKILGPFGSRDLALEVRTYVEQVKAPRTFWVDEETGPSDPAPAPGGVMTDAELVTRGATSAEVADAARGGTP